MHTACTEGNPNIVESLLHVGSGVDVNEWDDEVETPLGVASVKVLVKNGTGSCQHLGKVHEINVCVEICLAGVVKRVGEGVTLEA